MARSYLTSYKPPVWSDIFQAYEEFDDIIEVESPTEVLTEPVFLNNKFKLVTKCSIIKNIKCMYCQRCGQRQWNILQHLRIESFDCSPKRIELFDCSANSLCINAD